jgi:hypothetical protein
VIDDKDSAALTNVYVLSVCSSKKEQEIVGVITPVLKQYGGICIVSDAKWIEH